MSKTDSEFVIPASHPALPGHFPGKPVVPGVLLLDALDQALHKSGRRLIEITNFKFLRAVQPDQTLRLHLVEADDDRGTAEFVGPDSVPVARGHWRAGAV